MMPAVADIWEMQIKTTITYHLIPFRMAIIKNPENKYCKRYGENKALCSGGGNVNGCGLYENSMEVPQQMKNRSALQSIIPLLAIYPIESNWGPEQGLALLCSL